jgi:hypothetical protein
LNLLLDLSSLVSHYNFLLLIHLELNHTALQNRILPDHLHTLRIRSLIHNHYFNFSFSLSLLALQIIFISVIYRIHQLSAFIQAIFPNFYVSIIAAKLRETAATLQ